MAIVTSVLYGNEKPTKEQIEEIRQAAKMPIVYDEDCPPLTKEQLKELHVQQKNSANSEKNRQQQSDFLLKQPGKSKRLAKGTVLF